MKKNILSVLLALIFSSTTNLYASESGHSEEETPKSSLSIPPEREAERNLWRISTIQKIENDIPKKARPPQEQRPHYQRHKRRRSKSTPIVYEAEKAENSTTVMKNQQEERLAKSGLISPQKRSANTNLIGIQRSYSASSVPTQKDNEKSLLCKSKKSSVAKEKKDARTKIITALQDYYNRYLNNQNDAIPSRKDVELASILQALKSEKQAQKTREKNLKAWFHNQNLSKEYGWSCQERPLQWELVQLLHKTHYEKNILNKQVEKLQQSANDLSKKVADLSGIFTALSLDKGLEEHLQRTKELAPRTEQLNQNLIFMLKLLHAGSAKPKEVVQRLDRIEIMNTLLKNPTDQFDMLAFAAFQRFLQANGDEELQKKYHNLMLLLKSECIKKTEHTKKDVPETCTSPRKKLIPFW